MDIWQKASELKQSGDSFVQITLVDVRGGAPQDIGAKCLITEKGLSFGTIGGGKVEANIFRENGAAEGYITADMVGTYRMSFKARNSNCGGGMIAQQLRVVSA